MDNNKIAIESLSMDLLRVALGYHKGSNKMADRFSKEALKRIDEVDHSMVRPYFTRWLKIMPNAISNKNKDVVAEDALMFSTITKNYAKKYL